MDLELPDLEFFDPDVLVDLDLVVLFFVAIFSPLKPSTQYGGGIFFDYVDTGLPSDKSACLKGAFYIFGREHIAYSVAHARHSNYHNHHKNDPRHDKPLILEPDINCRRKSKTYPRPS